jgi:hypothetical protein
MAAKSPKKPRVKAISTKGLIRKLRKPLAPPTRVVEDDRKYKRSRELERLRHTPNRDDN